MRQTGMLYLTLETVTGRGGVGGKKEAPQKNL
jgi:hypothetical protein